MKVYGNRPAIQPKISVGAPGDKYEQEADQMAQQVMSRPAAISHPPIQRLEMSEEEKEQVHTKPLAASITPLVQRETAPAELEEEQEQVQMKRSLQRAAEDGSFQASTDIESQLSCSKGGGSPLPDEVRSFMEPRFGADFSQVRVHTGGEAVQMNKELGAQAFTHGSDIYFGVGKSPAISELTAHELTHVIQQKGAGVQVQRQTPPPQAAPPQPDQNQTVTRLDPAKITAVVEALAKNIKEGPSKEATLKAPLAGKSAEEIEAIKQEYLNKYKKDLDSALREATINPLFIQEVVDALIKLVSEGGKEETLRAPLAGKSKEELEAIKAGFQAKHGKELEVAIKEAILDPEKISAAADALFKAIDGWGTDEDAIMKALAGKSPLEIAAIKRTYNDHYGRNLDKDIESELGGDDLKEAQAHLSGDKAQAAIAALSNSIGTFNDDEEKIEETLTSLSPEELKKLQELAVKDPAIKAKLDKVVSHLDDEDKEVTEALLKGEKGEAAAIRLNEAMEGLGTDEKAVYKYLEGKSSTEIDAIREAYKNKTGRELVTDIVDDFSDAEKDLALALERGDKAGAAAARMKDAAEGLGTDEKGISAQLKGKTKEERDAIIKAYEVQYGEGSFDAMLQDELSDDDLKQAQQFKEKGELDPAFALKIAINGLGTDEDLIKETLKGKTADEIKAIREAYAKETKGGNLDRDLGGDVDGRDAFEIGQMLKGKPQTPKEHYERAMERYEFERGDGSTAFSRGVMDAAEFLGMHSKGEMLEHQTNRLKQMFDEKGELKPGYTKEDVEKIAGYQETDATNYKEAKEAVGNAVTTVGTIAVAALATICTKGAAAPWLVAVISGVTSGAANMAMKYGMEGAAYGGEDISIDTLTSALTAALGGALAEKTKFLAKLNDIAKALGEDMAKKVAVEALKGAVKGAASGAIAQMMNDKNWREGVPEYLQGILEGALVGGAVGGVTGAATATVKAGLENKTSSALIEAGASVVGAGIGEGVSAIKGEYKGRLEDLLGRLLVAGASSAAEDIATTAAGKARLIGIANLVVAAGDDMPTVQRILAAQVKYLGDEDKKTLKVMILKAVMSNEPDMTQSKNVNRPDSHYERPY
jgi:hypothetical protein